MSKQTDTTTKASASQKERIYNEAAREAIQRGNATARRINAQTQADKRTLQAEKPQHSPLPWRTVVETEFEPCAVCSNDGEEMVHLVGGMRSERATNAKLIVASVNHAQALAEACQMFLTALNKDQLNHAYAFTQKIMAAWESSK